jgi:hypothetical protein
MLRDVMVFSLLLLLCVALTSCGEVVWENPLSGAEEKPGDTRLPGAWGIVDPKTGSKYKINGRRLRLFYPASGDFVEQAVEEGRISGEGIGEGGMLIHSSSREVWEFITKCQREKLFKRLDFEPIIKFR